MLEETLGSCAVSSVLHQNVQSDTEAQHRLTAPTATDEAGKAAHERERRDGPCPQLEPPRRKATQAAVSAFQYSMGHPESKHEIASVWSYRHRCHDRDTGNPHLR
jgi:hypothetical protein